MAALLPGKSCRRSWLQISIIGATAWRMLSSPAQAINPFDLVARRRCREYIVFDRFEFFGDLVDDWEVIIANKVENGVHDCALAQAQQLWIALATLSHFGVGGRRAVPD